MQADGGNHFVGLSINHAQIVGFGVDGVNLVLAGIGCQSMGSFAHGHRGQHAHIAQVHHRDVIAAGIADVSVFAAVRAGLRNAGTAAHSQRQQRE